MGYEIGGLICLDEIKVSWESQVFGCFDIKDSYFGSYLVEYYSIKMVDFLQKYLNLRYRGSGYVGKRCQFY